MPRFVFSISMDIYNLHAFAAGMKDTSPREEEPAIFSPREPRKDSLDG
jgi:hypothetical protein